MALHPSLLTSAPIPETGRDAKLIAACNAFAEAEIAHHAPDWENDADQQKAHEAAYTKLFEFRATTIGGFRARARAVALYIYPDEAGEWHWQQVEALLSDMLQLPDPEPEPEAQDEPEEARSPEEDATLEQEDPWQVLWGSPPFREQFPLWERQPKTMDEWLKCAESEAFPLLFCEQFQRKSMADLEANWRNAADHMEMVYDSFIGLHVRFSKMANALHGEAIRVGLARLRVRHVGKIGERELVAVALLGGYAMASGKREL